MKLCQLCAVLRIVVRQHTGNWRMMTVHNDVLTGLLDGFYITNLDIVMVEIGSGAQIMISYNQSIDSWNLGVPGTRCAIHMRPLQFVPKVSRGEFTMLTVFIGNDSGRISIQSLLHFLPLPPLQSCLLTSGQYSFPNWHLSAYRRYVWRGFWLQFIFLLPSWHYFEQNPVTTLPQKNHTFPPPSTLSNTPTILQRLSTIQLKGGFRSDPWNLKLKFTDTIFPFQATYQPAFCAILPVGEKH